MKTKKKNIKTLIDSLNIKDWDYYISETANLPSFDNKPDTRCDGHFDFIKQMFEISGKTQVVENDRDRYEKYLAANHVSSVFLLGIIINKHLDLIKVTPPELSDEGKSDEDEKKILEWIDLSEKYESNLLFVWFLSVLYHDIAKHIEESGKENAAISNLEDLYERFQIEHKLLDKEDTTPCTHLTSIRKEYFKFRRVKCGKLEHGILAGIVLYDRLVKVRIANQNNKETKLKWDEGVEKLYKLASDAVSIHNIWPETASELPGFYKNAARSR